MTKSNQNFLSLKRQEALYFVCQVFIKQIDIHGDSIYYIPIVCIDGNNFPFQFFNNFEEFSLLQF